MPPQSWTTSMTLSITFTEPGSVTNSDSQLRWANNNHVEGWHSQLKRIVGKPHPNVFKIVDVMKKEQATTEMNLEQFAAGATQPPLKEEIHLEDLQAF